MKRWFAIWLHGVALRLDPMIAIGVRNAVIQQLAAEHEQQQQAQQRAQIARSN